MPNIPYKEFLRKHTTEDIVNKMDEDAPANAAGSGNVAGIGVGPDGEPGIKPNKKKDERDPLMFGKYKTLKRKIKESDDNNSTLLKGVIETINKLEDKIDEKNGFTKAEVTVEVDEEKQYVSFREKYNVKKD
jgi:hypothetical protein